jgi:glutamate carboxypeptidase
MGTRYGALRGFNFLEDIAGREPEMVRRLRELVEMETPSHDKRAVDAAVKLVAGWCKRMGGRVKVHRQKKFGDLLEARFGRPAKGVKPILVLGHLDTVWAKGTLAKMPWRESAGKIYGPGIFDMKAGVVMAVGAIASLLERNLLTRPVTLLLVSEEELGSVASRAVTERIAKRHSAVLVLEPAQGARGAYKTARKGVGRYRVEVRGVAAHSGVDFARGHSAVAEMARLLVKVAGMTDVRRGMTFNPGVVGGGTQSNVVAASAWADIDVRVANARDARRAERLLRGLKCVDKACRLTVGLNRPPMERSAAGAKLFGRAKMIAAEMGFELTEAASGGGSDGNFTAALGVPTLDGMGAMGDGAHAVHEHIVRRSLVERAALLAGVLAADA